jgi:hypothetical protein
MVMVAALVLAMGIPGQASALTCTQVGGTDVGGNCTISTPITAFCPFVLTVPGDLLITGTGSIDCGDPAVPPGAGAQPITISVGGDMEMRAGSSIRAENSLDGGNGGNITLTVGGNFTMRGTSGGTAGAVISSSKTNNGTSVAGNIRITVGNVTVNPDDLTITCATTPAGDILVETGARILANNADGVAGNIKMFAGKNATINGQVLSVALLGEGKGGQITIDACCDLVVGDTGQVVSRGRDPGADLVHLQGCVVQILGLVASTGPAHEPPFANVCNVNRPGKPADSGACVEIWAGTTLLIDSTGTHKGEVNADIGTSGGTQGFAWIDILANGAITIRGNATAPVLPLVNNNDTNPAYAVHANMFLQNGHGGDITVISKDSTVTMFGRAIQANASTANNGGQGGHIVIQGNGEVAFGTGVTPAFVQAAGDITGGSPAGGTVNAKSFNGNVTGIATSQISVLGPGGLATLTGCVDPAGTYLGIVIGTELDVTACGGSPTLPIPAATLIPSATCAARCQPPPPGNKRGVKFNDLNKDGVQDANEPGLIGWTIHLFGTGTMALLQTTVTLAANPGPPTPDEFYAFSPLPPGNYTVCEALQAGWTQTAPLAVPPPAGETLANCAPFGAANGLTLGPRGYSFTITAAAEVFRDNDFGNHQEAPVSCIKRGTKFNDLNGDGVKDPGDPGLPGWKIRAYSQPGNVFVGEVTTGASGAYEFPDLACGTYTFCEVLQSTWTQTFPAAAGGGVVSCAGLEPVITLGPLGYQETLVDTAPSEGNDFGNHQQPPPPGGEGCTPGYWKQDQHFDSWVPTGFKTNQQAGSVFSSLAAACPALAIKTLLDSLGGGGGETFCQKVQILIRAAVAAVLNAAHPGVDYPRTVAEIQSAVKAAIASGDKTTVTNLATALDKDNNLRCPLN